MHKTKKLSRPALRAMPLTATCTLIPHRSSDPISKRVKRQLIGYLIGLQWVSAHKSIDRDICSPSAALLLRSVAAYIYFPREKNVNLASLASQQTWRKGKSAFGASLLMNREAPYKHLNLFWLSFWHNCFRISLLTEVCIKYTNYLIIHKTHTAQYRLILWLPLSFPWEM